MNCILKMNKRVFFVVIAVVLFAASCKQDKSNGLTDVDDNGGYASDASRIELINNDIISISDAACFNYNGAFLRTTGVIGTCAIVATDTASLPHRIHISFGATDCVCLDGKKRRGNIIITYNGHYIDTGSVHTVSFENYYQDDIQILGKINFTRVDTTIIGNWYYLVSVDDSLNPAPNQYIGWKGTLLRRWIAGAATGDRNDDVLSISGNATLTRANLHQFGFNIATPLKFSLGINGCYYCQSGVVNVAGYNGPRVLNYGNGSCDNQAQLNIGLVPYQIFLTQ